MNRLYLVLAFQIFFIFHNQCQSLFDFENSIRYGNYLLQNNAHKAAIVEYERASFLGKLPDTTQYKLIICYFKTNGKSSAFKKALEVSNDTSFYIKKAKYLFDISGAYNMKKLLSDSILNPKQKSIITADYYLFNGNWDASINTMQGNELLDGKFKAPRYPLAIEGFQMKKKSPFLAATFSTIIPGTGKIYTGEWRDGLFSVLLIAGSVLGTWRAGEIWGYTHLGLLL
ncbi:MAG: hypothetical protein SFY32_12695 [Bacteroidota bacterium]|nr:hypothetical protein [Bacteroidota bacterium]